MSTIWLLIGPTSLSTTPPFQRLRVVQSTGLCVPSTIFMPGTKSYPSGSLTDQPRSEWLRVVLQIWLRVRSAYSPIVWILLLKLTYWPTSIWTTSHRSADLTSSQICLFAEVRGFVLHVDPSKNTQHHKNTKPNKNTQVAVCPSRLSSSEEVTSSCCGV